MDGERETVRSDRRKRLSRVARGVAVAAALAIAFVWGLWIAAPASKPGAAEPSDQTWTCSMHPQIRLPEPGQCPICGMDLIPLGSASGPETEITISERAKALARIRTTPVHRTGGEGELRLLGRLDYAETELRTISPWTGGRIDRLFVRYEGAQVKAGQAVASLYSPEAFGAQQELVSARKQLERLENALPVAKNAAEKAVQSAEMRVQLLGVSPKSVKVASRNVAVISAYSGTVVEQLVREGAYVAAGEPIFRIANLGTLWAQLDAYEGDLAQIQVNQPVVLEIASFPGERFEGRVAFVDPVVQAATRTARVRVEVDNRDGRLRAGMFADAIIKTEGFRAGAPLVIPTTAPLFTGKRSLVYVELPNRDEPTYEAREVELGPAIGHHFPVVTGLREGERVVIQGAFVLDSELQIRGGRSMMALSDDAERSAGEAVAVDEAFLRGLAPVLERYLALQAILTGDDHEGARRGYASLREAVEAFSPTSPRAAREVWEGLRGRFAEAAGAGTTSADLEAARRAFEDVSAVVVTLLRKFGNPLEETLNVATCPMALEGRAAQWVQRGKEVENPYRGQSMLRCGSIDDHVAPADRLGGDAPRRPPPAPAAPGAHGGH
jgi:membrane fusion protein, copper/silver efflux system